MILEDKNIDFDLWCTEKSCDQPTFKYWHMVIRIILLYLAMMKSIRDGDFEDCKSSLFAIMPFFFANDNTHYSRWGTIHLHDMLNLYQNSPSIYDQFISWNLVLHESHRIFSAVALDQAHEHNNRFVKSDGGVIGITEKKNSSFALDDFRASNLLACEVLWRFGEWQYKDFPSWGCPLWTK